MKKFKNTKRGIFQTSIIACLLLIISCNNNLQPEDTRVIAEERNEVKFDNNNEQQDDAQFLVIAAENNLEAIHLGKLAQEKGNSADVKQLGKMMVDAHTKLQNELVALAKGKQINIPTSHTNDTNDSYDKLNKKNGKDFDKSYTDRMKNKHEDIIEDYEGAYMESKDEDIRNWAMNTLPILRTHLNKSIESQDRL